MPDVTVTLTEEERWALDSVAVLAIEGRPIPDQWTLDGTLRHRLATASRKLRAAAPGPLDRLEAWMRSDEDSEVRHVRDAGGYLCEMRGGGGWHDTLLGRGHGPTLAAAVEQALKQAQEGEK